MEDDHTVIPCKKLHIKEYGWRGEGVKLTNVDNRKLQGRHCRAMEKDKDGEKLLKSSEGGLMYNNKITNKKTIP